VWRVDIEILRDPVTGRRRRTTRQIEGHGGMLRLRSRD
jgi:hypothetical protein